MRPTSLRFATLLTLGSALPLFAQEHEHEHGPSGQLGRVVFPVSCNAAAQRHFEHGMAALHSFWWDEGATAFHAVVAADSTCAMAYWGLAVNAWGNPFLSGPSGDDLQQGAAAAARGLALGAPTARERGLLAAAGALYRDYQTVPSAPRLQAYSDTLRRVHRTFPGDAEIAMYYALSLVATASPADTTLARQKRAAAILNPLFRRFPQHPGLAHYIIHANDSPRLASLGLEAARRYAQIAPAAPHALHMPSHIFVRLGLWDETIEANKRAFEAGVTYAHMHHLPIAPEQLHALDYMVYGFLQEGRDSAARQNVIEIVAQTVASSTDALAANYNGVAMEARLPLERSDWEAAARLPIRAGGQGGIGAALARFTRGLGAARNGDTAQARAEVVSLDTIERALAGQPGYNWSRVVGTKRLAAVAWLELATGDTAAALRDARAAADREDLTEKHPVTPGELLPARELEGDMLAALGRYAAARAAYEATLTREPGRARSVFGSARAAELAGDTTAARSRYQEFLKLMQKSEGSRVELWTAREFLSRRR
jgi:tetratricopeptide (TPR) repeat protein